MTDHVVEHWEEIERRAFEAESIFFGTEPEDQSRIALRGNAYDKIAVEYLHSGEMRGRRIEGYLLELRTAARIVTICAVLMAVGVVLG